MKGLLAGPLLQLALPQLLPQLSPQLPLEQGWPPWRLAQHGRSPAVVNHKDLALQPAQGCARLCSKLHNPAGCRWKLQAGLMTQMVSRLRNLHLSCTHQTSSTWACVAGAMALCNECCLPRMLQLAHPKHSFSCDKTPGLACTGASPCSLTRLAGGTASSASASAAGAAEPITPSAARACAQRTHSAFEACQRSPNRCTC